MDGDGGSTRVGEPRASRASLLIVVLTRKTYEGFKQWTAAILLLDLGLILIGLRGIWPAFLAIVVGNGAVLGAILLIYDGRSLFAGGRPKRKLYLVPLVGWGIPFFHFTYLRPIADAPAFVILVASLACVAVIIVLTTQRTEQELKTASAEVKALQGIIPVCASCKRVRDEQGYWNAVESYVHDHAEAEFSPSPCPGCVHRLFPDVELQGQ